MALIGALVLAISVLQPTYISYCLGQDLPVQTGSVGVFFHYKIPVDKFASNPSSPGAVKFTVSKLGGPDLPKWLQLEQDTPSEVAYIYGTPPNNSPNNITLEITGWDKSTYATNRKNMVISIDNSKEPPRYVAEFIVTNFNLDGFLFKLEPAIFKGKLEDIWRSPKIDLKTVKVESMLDRGGRVPVPPGKEGVFIAIGGDEEYTLLKEDWSGCPGLKPSIKLKFDPSNHWVIDWCKVKLYDTKDPSYIGNASFQMSDFKDPIIQSSYSPPKMNAVPRDYGDLYVVVLILPIIIVLLIVIVLAIIMCCFREGRAKRDAKTPRPQLDYHDSILRTTFHLRKMDSEDGDVTRRNNAQTPRRGSPTHTSTPYERTVTPDDDETPRGAPPPYRLPPPAAVSVTSPDGTSHYYQTADRT